MHGFVKFFIIFVALVVGNVIYLVKKSIPVPNVSNDTWWGPGVPTKDDESIRPFKISVPDSVLSDLKSRLKNHRPFAPPLEHTQQQYGMNTNLLNEIVDFWGTEYEWREREVFLNQYPQFKTRIQGLDVHFIRVKPTSVPKGGRVVALLLLHGWPGSVREFYEIIPRLTAPRPGTDFVFEVVVPSLPGYGFSQAAAKPGMSTLQMAAVFNNLMQRLGIERYYVQGGDWGSAIASDMAVLYPESVQGIHLNMCFSNAMMTNLKLLAGSIWPRLVVDKQHEHKMYPLGQLLSNWLLEFGYMHIQATKPDTVGVGLSDSPVGLAAYILEKFTTWTNPEWKNRENGGLLEKFTYTQLLDNVMIYWITNSISSSMRLYSESFNSKVNVFTPSPPITVPSACAVFEHEVVYHPPSFLRDRFLNLIQIHEFDVGGHFAAFEVPDILAEDVWSAVSKFEKLKK